MICPFRFWYHVDLSADSRILEKHAISSALKMETACFSKMLTSTNESTQHQNTDCHPPLHCCEKPQISSNDLSVSTIIYDIVNLMQAHNILHMNYISD
jgi:hypothetical protein